MRALEVQAMNGHGLAEMTKKDRPTPTSLRICYNKLRIIKEPPFVYSTLFLVSCLRALYCSFSYLSYGLISRCNSNFDSSVVRKFIKLRLNSNIRVTPTFICNSFKLIYDLKAYVTSLILELQKECQIPF